MKNIKTNNFIYCLNVTKFYDIHFALTNKSVITIKYMFNFKILYY